MKQTIYTSHVLLTAYSSEYLDTHAGSSASASRHTGTQGHSRICQLPGVAT